MAVYVGTTAHVTYSHRGSEPVVQTIEWLIDNVVIPGAVGKSLIIPQNAAGKELTARVTLTNIWGTKTKLSLPLLVDGTSQPPTNYSWDNNIAWDNGTLWS
jgi:hypothetical protein